MCDMATMIFSLFVFFILPATAIDGFSKNCKLPTLHQGSHLKTQCYDDCSACCSFYNAEIDLNNCVGNENGELVAKDKGGFSSSCSDCTMGANYLFTCTCPDHSQTPKQAYLDLRTVLVNNCGRLACMSHISPQGSAVSLPEPDMRDMLKRGLHPKAAVEEDTTSFTTTTIPPSTTFMFTSTRTFTAGHGAPSEITTPPGISISTLSQTVIFPNTTSTLKIPLIVWPSTLVTFTSGRRAHDVVRRDTQHAVVKRAPATSQRSVHWRNETRKNDTRENDISNAITEMLVQDHHTSTSVSFHELTLPTVTISIETSVFPGGTTWITHWNYSAPHEHHSTHHQHGTDHLHHGTARHNTDYPVITPLHHNHTSTIPNTSTLTSPIWSSEASPTGEESTGTSATHSVVSSESNSLPTPQSSESITKTSGTEAAPTSTAETTSSTTATTSA